MGAQMLVSMAYYALPRTSKFTNLLLRLVIMLLHYFSIFWPIMQEREMEKFFLELMKIIDMQISSIRSSSVVISHLCKLKSKKKCKCFRKTHCKPKSQGGDCLRIVQQLLIIYFNFLPFLSYRT